MKDEKLTQAADVPQNSSTEAATVTEQVSLEESAALAGIPESAEELSE